MKYTLKWLIIQVLILVGIPLASIYVLPADAGMLGMLVMFMGINPVFFAIQGVSLGGDWRHRWYLLPIALVIFFLGVSTWLGAPGDQILIYVLIYLVVGVATMAISAAVQKKA